MLHGESCAEVSVRLRLVNRWWRGRSSAARRGRRGVQQRGMTECGCYRGPGCCWGVKCPSRGSTSAGFICVLMRPLFQQRPSPWTLAAAWFWTRARVESTTSAGTTTGRPTPAPSSGTEAAAATGTASTRRTSAGRRVWFPGAQVPPVVVYG